MIIVVDQREKAPFGFQGNAYEGITTETGTLFIGDYSVKGLEESVAVERKSLPDLIMCLSRERDRFEKELIRSKGLDSFLVVVESSFEELAHGRYRSQMDPHAAAQSVMAFGARYRCGFFFAGSRPAAEYVTASFLRQYVKSAEKKFRAVMKASEVKTA